MRGGRVVRALERLATRRFGWIAAVVGVLLASTSLGAGFGLDDDLLRSGVWSPRPWWSVNLFEISRGNVWEIYELKDLGLIPWLAVENYRASFWRPLASLTHHLDFRLWQWSAAAMHAHTLVWFAALIAAVTVLYRRTLPPAAAGLAALLFAVDDAHGVALGWIASRNVLVAGLFGVLAIHWHHRWRAEGSRWGAWLSPAALLAALLSTELALGVVAYLAAHVVLVERGRRLRATLPWVGVVLFWFLHYRLFGHGARASEFYVDPLGEPASFLRDVAWKAPAYVAAQLVGPPSSVWLGKDAYHWIAPILAAAIVAWVGSVVWPLLRRDRMARFWAAGSIGSVLPACAGTPGDRLLVFTGIGAMALVAQIVVGLLRGDEWLGKGRPRRWLARSLGVLLVAAHAVAAPAGLALTASRTVSVHQVFVYAGDLVTAPPPRNGEELVLLNAPGYHFGVAALFSWAFRVGVTPEHVRVLYAGSDPLRVSRADERTLLLRCDAGFRSRYRPPEYPLHPGNGIMLTGMLAIVREVTEDGMPKAVTFQFKHPLGSDRYRVLAWDGEHFDDVGLPSPGRSATLTVR